MHEVVGSSLDSFLANVSTTLETRIGEANNDMDRADKAIQAADDEYKRVVKAAEAKRDGIVEAQEAKYEAAETSLREYRRVQALLK